MQYWFPRPRLRYTCLHRPGDIVYGPIISNEMLRRFVHGCVENHCIETTRLSELLDAASSALGHGGFDPVTLKSIDREEIQIKVDEIQANEKSGGHESGTATTAIGKREKRNKMNVGSAVLMI